MLPKLAFLSLAAMAVHAAPAPSKMAVLRQDIASASAKLFIGGGPPGTISVADFDGKSFKVVTKNTIQGSSPSWLLFKEPNVLYAVDENTNTTRTFSYNPNTDALEPKFEATGSSGVVSLEFNKDRTRMLGAAYGQGQIDVWDTSDPAGSLKLLKQIPSEGPNGPDKSRQEGPHPHQVLLDPSGRYFLVNDLGKDTISVIDTVDDKFNVVHRVNVKPAGAGPRHGAFYPPGQKQATHYFLACEMGNIINVYGLAYNVSAGGIAFALKQTVSTFGDNKNHTGAGAGEISVSADGKHLYVSNRLTGGKADNIAHFTIDTCQDEPLRFVKLISSGGGRPRMFSLSKDGKFMFAANQDPAIGLSALRIGQDGSLQENPVASMPLSAPDQGPMYVKQI